MTKRTLVSIGLILSIISLSFSSVSAASDTLTITDGLDDVIDESGENVSYPDVDIYQIICEQDGENVELSLKLAPGGSIKESISSLYAIGLITSHAIYIGGLGDDGKGNIAFEIIATSSITEEDSTIAGQYSGFDTDTLTLTFKLMDDDERIISAFASVGYIVNLLSGTMYYDDLNLEGEESIFPDAGGPYSGKTKETITFTGSLDEGDPSDYEWIWMIDGTSNVLEGLNPTYKFLVPGTYSGTLYVYDSMGNYGIDYFDIEITGTSSGDGGVSGDDGGSGILIFIAIIVIVIIAGIAVVIYLMRR